MVHPADVGDTPPTFRIDLSLPPSERYVSLARIYRHRLLSLTHIFDELVTNIDPRLSVEWVKSIARLFLRRLHTHEETEEIKGICRVTGIELYLLVALNVVLDMLMGCTSGAALSKEHDKENAKMLHFRTLDWDMDGLRQLVVQLEFVRSSHSDQVLATSITYVGFVGVLTGVRKGLSVTLNFRPYHNVTHAFSNYQFYGSLVLVLLGVRQSISSLLRQYILPSQPKQSLIDRIFGISPKQPQQVSLDKLATILPKIPTTAAYLVFCDGVSAIAFEKDHRSAIVQRSSSFVVATNTDVDISSPVDDDSPAGGRSGIHRITSDTAGLADLLEDSHERRECMKDNWNKKKKLILAKSSSLNPSQGYHPSQSQPRQRNSARVDPVRRTRSSNISFSTGSTDQSTVTHGAVDSEEEVEVTATSSEIIEWIAAHPITNDTTHFATVLDPLAGTIVWLKRHLEPLGLVNGVA